MDDPFGFHLLGNDNGQGRGDLPHRAEMERVFGESFGDVQVTTGDSGLGARGIRGAAEGNAVRFADAQPDRGLVAHELTHVVQQRQAGSASVALSAESHPGDAAEVEARAIGARVGAGDLSPVTVRATPVAAVHFDRDLDERADDLVEQEARDGWDVTAPAYFHRNLRHILLLIREQVAAASWPFDHARVQWAGDLEAVAAALTSRLTELGGEHPEAYRPFWHPVELWTVIDSNRPLTGGSPGEYAKGKPTAKGPMRRDGVADEAVAIELVALLRRSFARMVPRFVAAADDSAPARVEAGQLVTSAPIDRLWARVLADPALVRHTPPTGKPGEDRTPSGPGTFRDGPRPITFEWMGSQDPRMWNVLRVTSPADPTAEEVAAQLYLYPGVAAIQSHNAYAIVTAAPFFVLPRTWAKDIPDAVRWASAEHASTRDEPIDAVLQSSTVDQAALAQGADEAAHPLARQHKAGHADTERLTTLLWRGSDQLAYAADVLAPWQLAAQVAAERAWVQLRVQALVGEPPEQIARWAPVIEAQQRVLTTATGAIVEVANAATSSGVDPKSSKAEPFRRTLAAYAAAIATSHLADLARERLATATAEREALALTFVDSTLADAASATESLRAAEGGSFDPSSDAGQLTRQRKELQRIKLRQRKGSLAGQAMDPDALEDVTISAGMVAVHARAKELGLKTRSLSTMLEQAQNANLVASIAAAFDSSFETLPGKLFQLAAACDAVERSLDQAGFTEELAYRPTADEEAQAAHDRHVRELRRAALARAQADLAALPATHGFDRLRTEALDAVRTNRLASLAIDVILLIAASVATSGLAAYAGGAARGFAIVRMGMTAERAAVAGGAVNVAVDSVLTAGVQTALTGDDLTKGTVENILANVGVRAALARFAPLMSALDADAAALWEAGGVAGKGAVVMAKGAAVGAELITAAGVSYVAQRLVRGAQPPSDEQATAWFIQGASMAIGRMIAARTTQLHAHLDRLGARAGAGVASAHVKLLTRVDAQARLAEQVTASGDEGQAMRLLIESRSLLDEEARLLRELDADPSKAAAIGMSPAEHAKLTRENASARADVAKQGMDVLPLRLAGVDEVVPGALWQGSSEQIATAIHQARAVGLDVQVVEVGNRSKRWRIRFGESERVLDIEERTPRATAGKDVRRPRAASATPEARAILRAKAAAELMTIHPSEARTEHATRGYLVTPAEGRRMAELFHDIDDAETIEYKFGMLVRIRDGEGGAQREWYFEFRDDAHATGTAASRAKTVDSEHGLPAPNVSTIEIYAYLGAKEIKGREIAKMPPEERAKVEAEANKLSPLLLAGHVAVSFDGGKTVYGFTPETPSTDVNEVIKALRSGKTFPGNVLDDTNHYTIAYEMAAKEGWNITVEHVAVTFDPAEAESIAQRLFGEMAANQRGEHPHAYWFPPRGATVPPDTTAENGQRYTGDCTANCAAYPRFVGIPIPEQSGRMTDYMAKLKEWAAAEAPIAGRDHTEDP